MKCKNDGSPSLEIDSNLSILYSSLPFQTAIFSRIKWLKLGPGPVAPPEDGVEVLLSRRERRCRLLAFLADMGIRVAAGNCGAIAILGHESGATCFDVLDVLETDLTYRRGGDSKILNDHEIAKFLSENTKLSDFYNLNILYIIYIIYIIKMYLYNFILLKCIESDIFVYILWSTNFSKNFFNQIFLWSL